MKRFFSRWAGVVLAGVAFSSQALAADSDGLVSALSRVAPELKQDVLRHAVTAMQCATARGHAPSTRLAVIDFSLPSNERRLWLFDLTRNALLAHELVAHGMGSGELNATRFSNHVGSHQSSLGLFRTEETYFGRHGYSLRMDGLEEGINSNARERAVVIHAAEYVSPAWILRYGRLGRSHGCPAVRPAALHQVVENLKGGQFLFSYYPDSHWLRTSKYLHCGGKKSNAGRMVGLGAASTGG